MSCYLAWSDPRGPVWVLTSVYPRDRLSAKPPAERPTGSGVDRQAHLRKSKEHGTEVPCSPMFVAVRLAVGGTDAH